jgi:hypothetical protein
MNVIKQVGNIQLNQGNLMANGLFNLTNTETKQVSYWFDHRTKNELMELNDEAFISEANEQFKTAEIDDKMYH